jgi:hypothetical protein
MRLADMEPVTLADSSFVSERTRSGIMARWQQELAMTDEQIGRLALAKGAGASGGAGTNAACLL